MFHRKDVWPLYGCWCCSCIRLQLRALLDSFVPSASLASFSSLAARQHNALLIVPRAHTAAFVSVRVHTCSCVIKKQRSSRVLCVYPKLRRTNLVSPPAGKIAKMLKPAQLKSEMEGGKSAVVYATGSSARNSGSGSGSGSGIGNVGRMGAFSQMVSSGRVFRRPKLSPNTYIWQSAGLQQSGAVHTTAGQRLGHSKIGK